MTISYTATVVIQASREEVFDHLVRPDLMVMWMGDRATIGVAPGDPFEADINGILIRGDIVALDRPNRFVVSWGELGHEGFPPGFSRVTFTLRTTEEGTELELRHDQLPEDQQTGYAIGWENYTQRLAIAAAGGDPGPDPFAPEPGNPAAPG